MVVLFFLSAFLSEIVGTIAGFGSSTIFLPLALLFVDFKTALLLVAIFHIFGNVGRIGFFHKGLDKTMLITFGLPSVVFTLVGALLVSVVSQQLLKGILGLFLVLYSPFVLWKENFRVKPTLANTFLGGASSGFFAGLIGTGGALRGAFLTAFALPKNTYIVTAATIGLVVDMTRIPAYVSQGFLRSEFFWYIPVLFVVAIASSYIAKRIVTKIPQKQFTHLVLVALFLIGLKFLYDGLQTD